MKYKWMAENIYCSPCGVCSHLRSTVGLWKEYRCSECSSCCIEGNWVITSTLTILQENILSNKFWSFSAIVPNGCTVLEEGIMRELQILVYFVVQHAPSPIGGTLINGKQIEKERTNCDAVPPPNKSGRWGNEMIRELLPQILWMGEEHSWLPWICRRCSGAHSPTCYIVSAKIHTKRSISHIP